MTSSSVFGDHWGLAVFSIRRARVPSMKFGCAAQCIVTPYSKRNISARERRRVRFWSSNVKCALVGQPLMRLLYAVASQESWWVAFFSSEAKCAGEWEFPSCWMRL